MRNGSEEVQEIKMSSVEYGAWVVSTNPLHADNGVGVIQHVRGEQAKVGILETALSDYNAHAGPQRSSGC